MKDKNKPIYVSKCCNSEMTVVGDSFGEGTNHYECNECHQPCDFIQLRSSQSLDKNKPKELDWAEKILGDYGKITGIYHVDGAEYNVDEKQLISFIQSLLTQQRTELLEKILEQFNQFGNRMDYHDMLGEIRQSITNLLNKKDE